MSWENASTRIFISYSSADQEHLEELEKYIKGLGVGVWHAGLLTAGLTQEVVDQKIAEADLMLLLISTDYLIGSSVKGIEMEKALQLHETGLLEVVPLILRYCPWTAGPLSQLQVLPKDKKPILRFQEGVPAETVRDRFYSEVTEGIYEIIQADQPTSEPLSAPPPGMEMEGDVLYGEKLYLLCDRYSQSDSFVGEFNHFYQEDLKAPVCFAIPGGYSEQHASLIERFIEQYIRPKCPRKKEPVDYIIVPKSILDDEEGGKINLKRKLAEKIVPAKGASVTPNDILVAKQGYEVVVLQHNIFTKDWNKTTKKIFEWYLNQFWNIQLTKEHPFILIFLNIIEIPGEKKKGGILASKLPDIEKTLGELDDVLQERFTPIEELTSVELGDMIQWFLDYATDLDLPEDDIMDTLYYSKDLGYQTMKKIESVLKPHLRDKLKI